MFSFDELAGIKKPQEFNGGICLTQKEIKDREEFFKGNLCKDPSEIKLLIRLEKMKVLEVSFAEKLRNLKKN